MNQRKIFQFSVIAAALMTSGITFAHQTYHFSTNPINHKALKWTHQDETVLNNDIFVSPTPVNVLLSDITLDKMGKAVNAVNNNKIELIAFPEVIPTNVIGVQLDAGNLTNTKSGVIHTNSDVKYYLTAFHSPAVKSTSIAVKVTSQGDAKIDNQGLIYAKSNNEQAEDSEAYGIYATNNSGTKNHLSIINDGDINVTSTGEFPSTAKGLVSRFTESSILNRGKLQIIANDNATGIEISPTSPSSAIQQLQNHGEITVSTTNIDSQAKGIHLRGGEYYINNSGSINVNVNADLSSNSKDPQRSAFGIYIENATATINSLGKINTSISNSTTKTAGYDLVATNSKVYIEQYNLTLGSLTPWVASSTSTIFLGDQQGKGKITLLPGKKEQGFVYGDDYILAIQNIPKNIPAPVMGNSALLSTITPDFTLQSKAHPDGGISAVSLNYAPTTSHAGVSMQAQRRAMAQVSDTINSRLHSQLIDSNKDAGSDNTSKNQGMFITPYGSGSQQTNSPSGYQDRRFGILLGYDYQLENGTLGWHAGTESATTDFSGKSEGRSEERKTYMLGVQGGVAFNNDIFTSASATWFNNNTDYRDNNHYLTTSYQNQNYRSSGLYSDLSVGKRWVVGSSSTITPILGISHLWQQRDSYSLNADDKQYTAIDTHYQGYNGQSTALHAKVRFDTRYALSERLSYHPFVTIGMQKTVYGNDISTTQNVANAQAVTLKTKGNGLVNIFDSGIRVSNTNGLNADIRFSGRASRNNMDYTGWMNLSYQF